MHFQTEWHGEHRCEQSVLMISHDQRAVTAAAARVRAQP